MREYLFRGKRKDTGEWVFGDLIVSDGKYYIHPQSNKVTVFADVGRDIVMHEVDPDTVCLYSISVHTEKGEATMKLINEREWKDSYEDCKALYRDKQDGQNRYDLYNKGFTDALDYVDDWLDALPNVDTEEIVQKMFIPCSEGTPLNAQPVLVKLVHTYAEDDYREYSVARYFELSDGKFYWCDDKYGYLEHERYTNSLGRSYKVVEWMPLPKLYTEVEE